MTVKSAISGLNGWLKVGAIVFACGILYNKVDNLEKSLAKTEVEQAAHEAVISGILSNHEQRIAFIEGRLTLFPVRGK